MTLNPKTYLPQKFVQKYEAILGEKENRLFLRACGLRLTKAIRLNTLKTEDVKDLKILKNHKLEKISYLDKTYFIRSEVSALGKSVEHLNGLFQIQEVSSLIPVEVLNPKPKEVVLDLTSAPGNKTSYIATKMKNKGLLVANEIDFRRTKVLIYTLKKLGITNTIVINQDGRKFDLGLKFDKVLLDAPCSCEGEINKKPKVLKEWSEKLVLSKSKIQKELILNAYDVLKKNGILVYSTCTLSPEENEEVIDYLIKKRKGVVVEKIEIKGLNTKEGILEYNSKKYNKEIKNTIRIWPHHTNLEGFYIAKIKKSE